MLGNCVGSDQYQEIENRLKETDFKDISLWNQPAILIAPAITGIEGAIPVKAVANLVKRLGLDVKPSVDETYCLIKGSQLFGLMGLISFDKDNIARGTVTWLKANLPHQPSQMQELKGVHLTPLGYRSGDSHIGQYRIEFSQISLELVLWSIAPTECSGKQS